ncbi:MAG TPA: GYF domain-containing protein [Gemmataceae bacterium]|jgi:TM2 domain-containing membrane protein YozV
MASEWYYSHNGERHGPISTSQLKEMAAGGRLRPEDLVWKDGMDNWTPAGKVKGLVAAGVAAAPAAPARAPDRPADAKPEPPPAGDISNRQLAVGLTALFGGALGLHRFVLGDTTGGIIRLLVSVLGFGVGWIVMLVIGMIEGVKYLRLSDEEFYETYVVGRKAWF